MQPMKRSRAINPFLTQFAPTSTDHVKPRSSSITRANFEAGRKY